MKKIKINQKNELGRTMLETLGVLAIMGILTLGGVSGYLHAMKRHKINEIMAHLNTLAHECSRFYTMQNGQGTCKSNTDEDFPYADIESEFIEVGNAFQGHISGLEQDLATTLLARLADWPRANAKAENNDILVQFNKDLSDFGESEPFKTACDEQNKCNGNNYCQTGVCAPCPDKQQPTADGKSCACPPIENCQNLTTDCTCETCKAAYTKETETGLCVPDCLVGQKPTADGSKCENCQQGDTTCGCGENKVSNGAGGCICSSGYQAANAYCNLKEDTCKCVKTPCADGIQGYNTCSSKTQMSFENAQKWCADQGYSVFDISNCNMSGLAEDNSITENTKCNNGYGSYIPSNLNGMMTAWVHVIYKGTPALLSNQRNISPVKPSSGNAFAACKM